MSALHRKLFRDLLHLRGQVTALTLVVMCGIATFVTMNSAYRALVDTQAEYYRGYRFADLFASAKRAPESLAGQLRTIPGVGTVETRVVTDAMLDVPGLNEPATARLISIPPRPRSMLNGLFLRKGQYVEAGRRGQVIASEAFCSANRLQVGHSIGAILNGRWQRLEIAGIALSPEFVYEIRGAEVLPDNKRFGVLWMSRDVLAPAFDMDGAFNDVSFSLAPGAIPAQVMAEVDRLLEPYGGRGSYGRDEQLSNRFLTDEIAQDRVTGIFVPAVFLGVAALLIHIVLSRLVTTQRAEIGVLKAFGYTNGVVGGSYVKFAILAILPGAIAGSFLGVWLGKGLANIYGDFFRFPVLRFEGSWQLILAAGAISCTAAVAGAWTASQRAFALPPAEAMRSESPPPFRTGLIERMHAARWLPIPLRMIFRNIGRRKGKAAMSITGLSLAVAIVILGRFFLDAIDRILDFQFTCALRENVIVWLNQPAGARARHAIARLPAVLQTEPYRMVVARLYHEHRSRRLVINGLVPRPTLHRIVGRDGRALEVPPRGMVISLELAKILGVSPGQSIRVEALEGSRPKRDVIVTATVDDMIGLYAYMDIRELNRLMGESDSVSGAFLMADPNDLPAFYRAVRATPAAAGMMRLDTMRASFLETVARSLNISTITLILFACVIAFGMVYNSARISLSERGHELASLRVLGFTHGEISLMLLGEQAVLILAALPIGFALGYAMAAMLVQAMVTELYRLPLAISTRSFAFAFTVVAAAAAISAVLIVRRLRRLDLVAVLKTRE